MSEPITIPIELIDVASQKILDTYISVLVLDTNSITQILEFESEDFINDETLNMTNKSSGYKYLRESYLKSAVVGTWTQITTADTWKLSIIINGSNEDMVLYFKNKIELMKVRKQVENWLYGK
jgi:hypothetical protein